MKGKFIGSVFVNIFLNCSGTSLVLNSMRSKPQCRTVERLSLVQVTDLNVLVLIYKPVHLHVRYMLLEVWSSSGAQVPDKQVNQWLVLRVHNNLCAGNT